MAHTTKYGNTRDDYEWKEVQRLNHLADETQEKVGKMKVWALRQCKEKGIPKWLFESCIINELTDLEDAGEIKFANQEKRVWFVDLIDRFLNKINELNEQD